MFTAMKQTGKSYYRTHDLQHVIKGEVNGMTVPFTLYNDEVCAFGLFDKTDNLLGYFKNTGITRDIKEAIYTDGFKVPMVKDAPDGYSIKPVATARLIEHNNMLLYTDRVYH